VRLSVVGARRTGRARRRRPEMAMAMEIMARDECCARGPRPLLRGLPVLGLIGRDREGRGWSYELVGSDGWEAGIVTSLMSLFSVVCIVNSGRPFISLSENTDSHITNCSRLRGIVSAVGLISLVW
jgi:hypothetical protein